jgi:hypothetical protein
MFKINTKNLVSGWYLIVADGNYIGKFQKEEASSEIH